jgi:ribosome-binding protein aMBF1 (putative translation factor)
MATHTSDHNVLDAQQWVETVKTVAERLAQARKEKGWTQQQA